MNPGQLTDIIIKVRKRILLKINVGLLLFKQSCTYMPIKYFIWYVIVAGWQETFRSAASRLAGDFQVSASRLAADLKVSCQPAGRRPRLLKTNTMTTFYDILINTILHPWHQDHMPFIAPFTHNYNYVPAMFLRSSPQLCRKDIFSPYIQYISDLIIPGLVTNGTAKICCLGLILALF